MVYDLFIWYRMLVIFEKDLERRKQNRMFVESRIQTFYAHWNKILEESGGDYVIGKKLTHADFWLASFVQIWDDPMEGNGPVLSPGFQQPSQADAFLNYTDNFPALKAHKEKVTSIPQIKEWIKKRPKTSA
ncbi:glutathione S-transferase 1-like [Folsomia candida]|nr:glutathione S-transferase 1-like [Folsomia candida]